MKRKQRKPFVPSGFSDCDGKKKTVKKGRTRRERYLCSARGKRIKEMAESRARARATSFKLKSVYRRLSAAAGVHRPAKSIYLARIYKSNKRGSMKSSRPSAKKRPSRASPLS